jgi:hypothetical protein
MPPKSTAPESASKKPASTAKPASTGGKGISFDSSHHLNIPLTRFQIASKSTGGAKKSTGAKKSVSKASDGEKKKRKKTRKET